MRTLVFASLSFVSAVTTGCLQQYQYLDPNAQELPLLGGDSFAGEQALEFTGGGALSGDIGPVKGFQGTRDVTIEGYDDGVCTYVTITGVGENGTGSMVVDVMPRVDELQEGAHGIGLSDETYEGSMVTAQASTHDGFDFTGNAEDGSVIMTRLPDGSRHLEVHALVDDGNGERTEAVGQFRLVPKR